MSDPAAGRPLRPRARHRTSSPGATGALVPQERRTRLFAAGAVAVIVAVAAATLIGMRPDRRPTALPPTPPTPAATTAPSRSTSSPPTAKPSEKPITCKRTGKSSLGGSAPSQICIPAIRVDATVMQLGLNSDRTVQVPPLSQVRDAGWYKYSATPGAVGPTVILGHVDSAQYGEGVFFKLGQLRSGDRITVTRGDGEIALYRVGRVSEVAKKKFPTQAVYGATSGPAIRLVTCGGRFDSATGNYLDNIIAYGTLVTLRKA